MRKRQKEKGGRRTSSPKFQKSSNPYRIAKRHATKSVFKLFAKRYGVPIHPSKSSSFRTRASFKLVFDKLPYSTFFSDGIQQKLNNTTRR
jgi:hypothetical protein